VGLNNDDKWLHKVKLIVKYGSKIGCSKIPYVHLYAMAVVYDPYEALKKELRVLRHFW
jgi:hypothetical protein